MEVHRQKEEAYCLPVRVELAGHDVENLAAACDTYNIFHQEERERERERVTHYTCESFPFPGGTSPSLVCAALLNPPPLPWRLLLGMWVLVANEVLPFINWAG